MATACGRCARLPVFSTALEKLDSFRQRTTYEAFGGALGTSRRSPLQGHRRDHLHSWVVAKSDGQPTGYSVEEKHPDLTVRERIISDEGDLRGWLQAPA